MKSRGANISKISQENYIIDMIINVVRFNNLIEYLPMLYLIEIG